VVRGSAAALIDLSKQPFREAREAIETIGADAPDRLAREELARLTIGVADYSLLVPGPPAFEEFVEGNGALVALRYGQLQVSSSVGFWLLHLISVDSQIVVNFAPDALAASGTVTRVPVGTLPPRMLYTSGDAAALPTGYGVQVSSTVPQLVQAGPLWVPPGRVLSITNATVADTTIVRLRVVQPRG